MNPPTISQVREAACIIRHHGVERFAPEIDVLHGQQLVEYVDKNRAFIGVYPLAKGSTPITMTQEVRPDSWKAAREQDKRTVKVMAGAEHEPGESLLAWRKRMKILPPWFQRSPDGDLIECPNWSPKLHSRTPDDPEPRPITERETREELSWPEQREFRWNDPEGYAQWVEDLKEEMGAWFDESLVLPEYRHGEKPAKAHPEVEDIDEGYFADMTVPEN